MFRCHEKPRIDFPEGRALDGRQYSDTGRSHQVQGGQGRSAGRQGSEGRMSRRVETQRDMVSLGF